MRSIKTALAAFFILFSAGVFAQETEPTEQKEGGHINENKFRQLYQEFSTPNQYRTGSGAPGPAYYQNEADYKMDIELDDRNQKLTGRETITYHNNSPSDLEYLWVQLDQNIRTKNSVANLKDGNGIAPIAQPGSFVSEYMKESFDGGFNITEVSSNGKPIKNSDQSNHDESRPSRALEGRRKLHF